MAATTTQTIRLLDCPACGKPIELHATYDVHRDEGIGIRLTAKVVTATLTMAGARVNHECPPPKPISFFTEGGNPLARGGIVSPAFCNPLIRED